MILNGLPLTSHLSTPVSNSALFFSAVSLPTFSASYRSIASGTYACPWKSLSSSSFHVYHLANACSLGNGKYSIATVSLYANGEIAMGENSHRSPVVCICSINLATVVSYSSFVYCLLRMQYCLPLRLTQPKQSLQPWTHVSE